MYSKCCSNNYFWLELLIYGNQSISLCSYDYGYDLWLKWLHCFAYKVVSFFCFVFGFLRIISESTGEWGFSGLTMEVPELRHWQSSDLYFVNSGHVFCVFLLKVILVFINTVCALSLSDVSIIESLFLTLSRW